MLVAIVQFKDVRAYGRRHIFVISPAVAGTLEIDAADLGKREPTGRPLLDGEWAGTGRELFSAFRAAVGPADEGASVFGRGFATAYEEEMSVARA